MHWLSKQNFMVVLIHTALASGLDKTVAPLIVRDTARMI
jgi:hypothetical protein